MFVRVKKVGPYQYLQIAQNRREGKRVKQSIIATLGRLDKLTASGAIDQLLRSAARFSVPHSPLFAPRASRSSAPYRARSCFGTYREYTHAWPWRTSCSLTTIPAEDTTATARAYRSRYSNRNPTSPPRTSCASAFFDSVPHGGWSSSPW